MASVIRLPYEKALRRASGRFRACARLQQDAGCGGTVTLRLEFGAKGNVTDVKDDVSGNVAPEVRQCLLRVARGVTVAPEDLEAVDAGDVAKVAVVFGC